MAFDAHKNFAYSTIATAPAPATTGTSLVVQASDGTKFPTVPFNATIWPSGTNPTTANAEIVRVTAIAGDTFTITRIQEGTSARTVIVGDQIAATITVKSLTDIEAGGIGIAAQAANDLIYASSATQLARIASAASSVLVTSAGSVPSLSTTLPGVRLTPRLTSIVSNATPTINTDNTDVANITALATAITSMTTNLSGTPLNSQRLTVKIKDDGTARAITWGASFRATSYALPTTTVVATVLVCEFIYNITDAVWDLAFTTADGVTASTSKSTLSTSFEATGRFVDLSSGGSFAVGTTGLSLNTTATSGRHGGGDWTVMSVSDGVVLGSPIFSCVLNCSTIGTDMQVYVGLGSVTAAAGVLTFTPNHIGFKITRVASGAISLYGTQGDGVTESASSALTTVAAGDTIELLLDVTGSTNTKYYWRKNGGSRSTATTVSTNMPTASSQMIRFLLGNDTAATDNTMVVFGATYSR